MAEAPRGLPADALERLDGPPAGQEDVLAFSTALDAALRSQTPSVGLGNDVRLRGERVIGSGLELQHELIQFSAFRSEDGGRRAFGRIARPSRRR